MDPEEGFKPRGEVLFAMALLLPLPPDQQIKGRESVLWERGDWQQWGKYELRLGK